MSMFDATPKGTPQPNVYALVAVCEDWGIGFHGGLLVRNSADMRHFKELTWDHTVRALLPYCSKAIVTINHCVRPADTFFPNLDDAPQWCARQRITTDEHGDTLTTSEGVVFEYVTYEQTAMD